MNKTGRMVFCAIILSGSAILLPRLDLANGVYGQQPGSDPPVPVAQRIPESKLGPVVAYALKHADPKAIANAVAELFPRRAEILRIDMGLTNAVYVGAALDVHSEIRGVIKSLDQAKLPGPMTRTVPASPEDHANPTDDSMLIDRFAELRLNSRGEAPPSGYIDLYRQAQQTVRERIQGARQRLSEAKTDREKSEALTHLRKILGEVFAQDMQLREQQAKEIETRLANLRKQFQEREAAREKIIELQLQVIEAEVAGLGFPGDHSSSANPPTPVRSSNLPGSGGKVVGSGSDASTRLDPYAGALDPEFRKRYSPDPQSRVAELSARGHFVFSPDRSLYAYIETKGPTIPEGNAEIRVCDRHAGTVLATAKIKAPGGKLKFLAEGVATENADGTSTVHIGFGVDDGKTPVRDRDRLLRGNTPQPNRGSVPTLDPFRSPSETTKGVRQGVQVPAFATSDLATVRDILAFSPETAGIAYDQPSGAEIARCRVVLEAGAAWSLLSGDGVLLRRFEDTNRDRKVDVWRYYKGGRETYRDVDTDHDGRIDRHVRATP